MIREIVKRNYFGGGTMSTEYEVLEYGTELDRCLGNYDILKSFSKKSEAKAWLAGYIANKEAEKEIDRYEAEFGADSCKHR